MVYKKDFFLKTSEFGDEAKNFALIDDPVFQRLVQAKGSQRITDRLVGIKIAQDPERHVSLHIQRSQAADIAAQAHSELLFPYDTCSRLHEYTDADPVLSDALRMFGAKRRAWLASPKDDQRIIDYLEAADKFEALQQQAELFVVDGEMWVEISGM